MTRFLLAASCVMMSFAGATGVLRGQTDFRPDEPAWIGLFISAALAWLENENRLTTLCGRASVDRIEQWAECEREKRSPLVLAFPARRQPNRGAELLGTVIVTAVPGRGFSAHYLPVGESRAQPFTPDLYDQDWGYGPYFHQTFLAQRDDGWFLLPEDPFPEPVWLQLGRPEEEWVERLHRGEILSTPRGDVVVLEAVGGSLRVRAEQPADMWCDEGDPPPIAPSAEILLTPAELYDKRGHLTIRPKSMRGC